MLIRFATEKDLPAWYALATGYRRSSGILRIWEQIGVYLICSKVSKGEALTAVDYMSGENIGFIGFSRTNNRITWFAVSKNSVEKALKPLVENSTTPA